MKISNLAIVGFGNVGQGLLQILCDRAETIVGKFGVRFEVVAVNDQRMGSLYRSGGLDQQALLAAAASGDLSSVPAEQYGWSVQTMLEQAEADTLVETSYTNLKTGQPALDYIRQALRSGKHVVTTNKGPIALDFQELQSLAQANHVKIGYEGTVMSGTPALALGRNMLAAAGIQRIQGILNGTTNFILTQMESGESYAQALAEAQSLGYAEADPSGDVEGFDTAGKIVILSSLILGTQLSLTEVDRKGITHLTVQDIQKAQAEGKRWKLIGSLDRVNGRVVASVQPCPISIHHPLASVSGATNAVTYTTDLLGEVTLIGPGAGRLQTGYAVLNDLLGIHGEMA